MIPRVCLNCDWAEPLLDNVNEPLPADCHALPVIVRIDDSRLRLPCKFFEMHAPARMEVADSAPEVVPVQDDEPSQDGGEQGGEEL